MRTRVGISGPRCFERPMSDIFTIQSEIAGRLADSLSCELSADTERAIAGAPTVDPEAYELTLRGRFLRNRETYDSLARAAELFAERRSETRALQ